MSRTTVDFGIDLGTTNSSIAVLHGTEPKVFRNNENHEVTPSVVWVDQKGKIFVGDQAKEQLGRGTGDAAAEFKTLMGGTKEKLFLGSQVRMTPEQLSAEVLKALKADVRQRTGEEIEAAVITVPAVFEQPETEATNRAARLAGLLRSPLLQEPVAASLAYGYQSESEREFWLVYDLGGGTFDAAVMQVRDGGLLVVNHDGDRQLGGKLIDWDIVDQLFVPTLVKKYGLSDFRRGSEKWESTFAKLKSEAERFKIRLSREASVPVFLEHLGTTDRREEICLDCELKRSDVERLMRPYVTRSVNICRRVLEEKRLAPGDIRQVLLVGGPTLTPYLRDRLADSQEGLGIALNFSLDPLTVVAQGAAIFAGTQRVETTRAGKPASGHFVVELVYKPIGAEPDPLVGGTVHGAEGFDVDGFRIEFLNSGGKPPWTSGKIPLGADGTFMTYLVAEKGRQNIYAIELSDARGTLHAISPDSLSYTIGLTTSEQLLLCTIGVATVNDVVDVFFPKGTPLPARRTKTHHTALPVRKGFGGDLIRIPIVGGEKRRAERNRKIGQIVIGASEVKRDVPVGSEVEITIEMDESRLTHARAYIPILDEEYPVVIEWEDEPELETLQADTRREIKRLSAAESKSKSIPEPRASEVLGRIREENTVHDIQIALAAADGDQNAARMCAGRLLDLKAAVDEVEDALEWPALVADAENVLQWVREEVRLHGKSQDQLALTDLTAGLEAAIKAQRADELRSKLDELRHLGWGLAAAQPEWWVDYFGYLKERRQFMSAARPIDALIAQGDRAIHNNDLDSLQAACRQLIDLLPQEEQEKARGYGGTTH